MDQSNFIVIIVEDVILKILKKKKLQFKYNQKAFHMFRPQFSLQTAVHPYLFNLSIFFFNLQSQSSELKFSAG